MVRYSVKCFDSNENLVVSAIIPGEALFSFIEKFKNDYTVKAYLMNEQD